MWWFSLVQLGFALFMLALVAERMRALCWRHAIGDDTLKALLRAAEQSELALIERWCAARPLSVFAMLWGSSRGEELDVREAQAEVREIASTRLRLLRVCATLASTLGLLGGILLLAGSPLPGEGLLALSAGAVERARMQNAIATMAIGVGTSALCFQALSVLRQAAQKLLQQADKIARTHSELSLRE